MFQYPVRQDVSSILVRLSSILIAVFLIGIATTVTHAQTEMTANARHINTHALSPTIIGGEEVTENIYPWTVALIKTGAGSLKTRQFCGGTLVTSEIVITAAHCTFRGTTPRDADSIIALIGTTSLDPENVPAQVGTTTLIPPSGQQIEIEQIIRHPDYVRSTANADIALLRLATPVNFPTIALGNPAQLSPEQRNGAMVLGWGRTESQSRSTILRQANVPLVEWETCRTSYATFSYVVKDNMVCAGYALGGKDACTGDSGGPLVAPNEYNADGTVRSWSLIGVVSWGRGCAQINAYGVYANIGMFSSWITTAGAKVDVKANPVGGASTHSPIIFLPVIQ